MHTNCKTLHNGLLYFNILRVSVRHLEILYIGFNIECYPICLAFMSIDQFLFINF